MYTDWILTQRAALELAARFAGARVQTVGQFSDGRFVLQLWQRGSLASLAFDVFAATPVVTVDDADLALQAEPGFVRRTGAALRGMTLLSVRSRKGDRVLRLDFGTRSRFGVQSGYAFIAELVPKFGNLVLLKDETVVAALKEFGPSQNAQRTIETGAVYEAPPLPAQAPGSAEELTRAISAQSPDEAPSRASLAALRALRPLLPHLVAVSLLTRAQADKAGADAVLANADEFERTLGVLGELPVIEYRDGGKLLQAHVTELHQFSALTRTQSAELLPLLAEARGAALHASDTDLGEKRRRAMARALAERETKLTRELRDLEVKLLKADDRAHLRTEGEAIFATLHELSETDRDEAKARAAELFTRYKKASASVPHIQSRRADVERNLTIIRELQWELERAADADLDDVAQALSALDPRAKAPVLKAAARKRKPLSIVTADGSRILIGRSPVENAELTFRTARPDDLWFHAQRMPGAHVILQRDDRAAPSARDIEAAASYAAFYSKGKNNPAVVVDYTQRKHVRKQPAAPPGLVFYTHPKSVTVVPSEPLPA